MWSLKSDWIPLISRNSEDLQTKYFFDTHNNQILRENTPPLLKPPTTVSNCIRRASPNVWISSPTVWVMSLIALHAAWPGIYYNQAWHRPTRISVLRLSLRERYITGNTTASETICRKCKQRCALYARNVPSFYSLDTGQSTYELRRNQKQKEWKKSRQKEE